MFSWGLGERPDWECPAPKEFVQHSMGLHLLGWSCCVHHYLLSVPQAQSDQHIPPWDPLTVYLSQRYNKLQVTWIAFGLLRPKAWVPVGQTLPVQGHWLLHHNVCCETAGEKRTWASAAQSPTACWLTHCFRWNKQREILKQHCPASK